ncbi:hypothetical protein FQZ97_484960 [compost metagenome]
MPHGLREAGLLHRQRLAQLAQVLVEAALLEVVGQRQLRGHRGAERGRELLARHRAREAPGRGPADAVAGREAFRERRAVQHQPLRVEGLGRRRAALAEVELGVHVVLDERQFVAREQFDQRLLLRVGHQAAQRVLEGGHEPAGGRLVRGDGLRQRVEVDAFARVRRHLDGAQAHALERLQRGIEGGRLDDHRVARPRHGREAQVERLERAVGDHDLLGRHRQAVGQVAQRDLAAQGRAAGREVVHGAPGVECLGAGRHELAQPRQRKQQRARKGRAEGHDLARHAGFEDVEHLVAHLERARAFGGARGQGGLGRRVAQAAAGHVVARAVARAHQPARLQQVVGLEHGGGAHAAAAARVAHGGQAVAGLEGAVADRGLDVRGQGFITLHRGAVVIRGDSNLIW